MIKQLLPGDTATDNEVTRNTDWNTVKFFLSPVDGRIEMAPQTMSRATIPGAPIGAAPFSNARAVSSFSSEDEMWVTSHGVPVLTYDDVKAIFAESKKSRVTLAQAMFKVKGTTEVLQRVVDRFKVAQPSHYCAFDDETLAPVQQAAPVKGPQRKLVQNEAGEFVAAKG